MECLPLEVVEIIAQHLSPSDLAACCATSCSWRDSFNNDLLWKHLCKQETTVYLCKTPCRVQPAFISPEVEGSGLDPVCQWRMNYMRENHLLNNWRSGRYKEENIPIPSHYRQTAYRLFYQEEFLITVNKREMEFVMWDLRCDPVIYVNNPCLLLPSREVNNFCLCGNRLVVVQGSAVSVFQINLMQKNWALEYIFFSESDEPTNFVSDSDVMKHTNWRPNNCITMVGNYLLANIDSKRYLHIWDIGQGLKLKKETLDDRGCYISRIRSSKTSPNDIIVFLRVTNRSHTKVVVYCLLSLTYYPCVLEGADYGHLHRDKIVVNIIKTPDCYWLVANYKTGEKIHRITQLYHSTFKVFDDKVIYMSKGGLNQIIMSTGEIKEFVDPRAITDFQLLGDKFICMQTNRDYGDGISRNKHRDIWEIGASKTLEPVSKCMLNTDCVETNRTLTKIIVEKKYKVNVIHFW